MTKLRLWFDVGIKRYTTHGVSAFHRHQLWFDVGIKRYTTLNTIDVNVTKLWFDVGIKRYTTIGIDKLLAYGCGLM